MKSAQKVLLNNLKLHLYILDRWPSIGWTDIYCTDKSCNFKSLPKCTELPPKFASSEQKLPVHIQFLMRNPINPPVESHWWILFTVLGLQKMNFGRSPHVFLLIESLPFPGTLLCVCPPPSTTTTTTTLLLLAYSHPQLPWVEREADKKSSEADSPSLTAQKGKITVMTTARITNVEDLDHV